ncbi:Rossmann-like and DUF2520 domain-containing protein [Kerstersia gyiorum]|uniref:Rossmann-like and DUF2520 domain-containing protein n=1 Tax=Kerstersia gyiorum TaxID=206506 RepID=UPI00209E0486|nr:DUF2520 domain-containing protein [Kerstersia gyiorum]MCP1679122.1 putative short-subunit dehydrogenase-like oxidoreductase (DUF2520 family) [Kerstersia gyiorum]MCP1823625.1 putative short-subunit dehydrogenase-like oxidoreductase (DUF2520 family) [Kerstersia gyiorum]MCP1827113.1 putative short-subunit dehydrogenase-like oxidoreductase (DUF2520 family) [Kerstersia gyiorum]MCW2450996.1 putative short-subunit dehydrogenase-like oxidoreductase (DUF2520 family) [Kerstersia gyiorum]
MAQGLSRYPSHTDTLPSGTMDRIGFIGAGRLARALAWHCHTRGLHVTAVASRTPASAQQLAARLPGCAVLDSAQAVSDRCSLVFITTPDAAIEPTAAAIHWRAGVRVVHCSGATEVAALGAAQAAGALTGGFHPMQTFADPEAALEHLPGCTVTIEAEAPLDAELSALATRLGCRINHLPPGARPLYHAAAGYASQFINALLHDAVRMWQSWGATEDDALHALLPLLHGTLASIAGSGIAAGMPGPVSRGDTRSVAGHVAALRSFDPATLPLYAELCQRTITLALQQGRIDSPCASHLHRLLAAPLP